MTKVLTYCINVIFLCIPAYASAQFIDIELDVDTELSATTEKTLSFGDVASNEGVKEVMLGDVNMGIFSITALENTELLINLDSPDALRNAFLENSVRIPMNLNFNYSFRFNDFRNSVLMTPDINFIQVPVNEEPGPWSKIYIYVYGTIVLENIPPGMYSNEVTLQVEYL